VDRFVVSTFRWTKGILVSGYSIHENVFTRDEMQRILDALVRVEVARSRAGPHPLLAIEYADALTLDPGAELAVA